MVQPVRFIHTADLHLGSYLSGLAGASGEVENILTSAAYDAFARICQVAVDQHVDFIVVAGDLYDEYGRSVRAARFFAKQCQRLHSFGIYVCVVCGNHDPYTEYTAHFDLPPNVKVFGTESPETYEVYRDDGVLKARVLGLSYRGRSESRKMYSSFAVPDESVPNIAILHTGLDPGSSSYVPCSLQDLRGKDGIHYWALGHLHKPAVLSAAAPAVVYAGTPQGRDVGECGQRGCFLVEINLGQAPSLSFVPIAPVVWLHEEVNLECSNAVDNLSELEQVMLRQAEIVLQRRLDLSLPGDSCELLLPEGMGLEGYVVRWDLTGRCSVHKYLEESDDCCDVLVDVLRRRYAGYRPFLWTEVVTLDTAPPLPRLSELACRDDLFRRVQAIWQSCLQEGSVKQALLAELGQIWTSQVDHENQLPYRFKMDEHTLREVLEQASSLMVARVLGRRE